MATPPVKPDPASLTRRAKETVQIVWRQLSGAVRQRSFWIGAVSGVIFGKVVRKIT